MRTKGLPSISSSCIVFHPVGFTLLELMVVVFIISISMAIIAPSIWESQNDVLRNEARHLSASLRYVYDLAVSTKETSVFRFDLDKDIYAFKLKGRMQIHRIQVDNGLQDIIIPSIGKITEGEVEIRFGPLGPEEPVIVHIGGEEGGYTILLNNITGRTKIYEGYRL